jgi:glycine/D-amino acid oxidase-like deaminating enzyme
MYKTADHVIIGARATGASIALQLAQRKAGRIVVIDQGFAGGRSACERF